MNSQFNISSDNTIFLHRHFVTPKTMLQGPCANKQNKGKNTAVFEAQDPSENNSIAPVYAPKPTGYSVMQSQVVKVHSCLTMHC